MTPVRNADAAQKLQHCHGNPRRAKRHAGPRADASVPSPSLELRARAPQKGKAPNPCCPVPPSSPQR